MKIQVSDHNHTIIFELNDSDAAQDLACQLPLTTKVENYSDDEKIFYPDQLCKTNTPFSHGHQGDLALYSPWGDVVMFYKEFSSAPGLYQLGHCVKGERQIGQLTGNITISLK